MHKKLTLLFVFVLSLIFAMIFLSCDPIKDTILIEDFDDVNVGTVPSGWQSDVITDYTEGDEDGPLVKNEYHGSTNRIFFLMQEALAGDPTGSNPNHVYGYSFTGYTYIQYEITLDYAGTLEFEYQSCGWYGVDGTDKGVPQGNFEFWLDLDLANIDTATNPDWTRPDEELYDGSTATVDVPASGTYRLTWKATKDIADTFEDRAAVDVIKFIPQQ